MFLLTININKVYIRADVPGERQDCINFDVRQISL